MNARTIPASEFRATCLKLLDEINASGQGITITKRGKPVAHLLPANEKRKLFFGCHSADIEILGDIVSPIG